MSTTAPARPQQSLSRLQKVGLVCALVAFSVPFVISFPGLSVPGHRLFAVFLLAIVLWVTEAIPLHATATVIILLEILFVSDNALLPAVDGFAPPRYSDFFATLSDPILMLFLGGFFLADCAAKFQLDRNLARVVLRPFGRSPRTILLGLMLITALFSMFMSNTATTATMMAVVLPVIGQLPRGDRMRAGFALAIPVAANIGGIGTPIGTPPNAIALKAIAQAGYSVGFAQWMLMTIPYMVLILLFAWLVMLWLFSSGTREVNLVIEGTFDRSLPAAIFYVTFAGTVLLWMTESLHGISSSIVGFLPVVILLSTRTFTTKDMQNLSWNVLWLVAGGIALGNGVGATGLDRWLIGLVSWTALPWLALIAVLCFASLLLGTFISHSATANLLVPIGISLASSDAVRINPVLAGVFIAIGASLAMAFPISTPPNAIAMSTGALGTRDMAIVGIAVGLFGWVLFVFTAPWLWSLLGVLPGGAAP